MRLGSVAQLEGADCLKDRDAKSWHTYEYTGFVNESDLSMWSSLSMFLWIHAIQKRMSLCTHKYHFSCDHSVKSQKVQSGSVRNGLDLSFLFYFIFSSCELMLIRIGVAIGWFSPILICTFVLRELHEMWMEPWICTWIHVLVHCWVWWIKPQLDITDKFYLFNWCPSDSPTTGMSHFS